MTEVYNLKVPVEAMRLGPNRVPAIAEWLCPPPDRVRGYFQYGEQPATIKLPHAELEVPVGHWVVRFGSTPIVLDPDTFEEHFVAAGGHSGLGAG